MVLRIHSSHAEISEGFDFEIETEEIVVICDHWCAE